MVTDSEDAAVPADVPPQIGIPPHAAANLRRCVIVSVPLGVVAVGLLTLIGHPLAGVLVCVGLALGAVNTYLVQRSVVKYAGAARAGATDGKRRFGGGVLARLVIVSAVALSICLSLLPDGIGVLGGLAAFQVLMLAAASVPLIRELRRA